MYIKNKTIPVILIIALLVTTLSCSYFNLLQPQENTEERPQEPPPQEQMPQEPPLQDQPPQEFPQDEPPPEEFPPPEEPQPQPQPPAGGSWSADIAVTDIYPGKQPYGMFQMRITNNGPTPLTTLQVNVTCSSERTDRNNGKVSSGGNANFNVILSLAPGATQIEPTSLTLDMNTFTYLVACEVHPTFNDPNPGNNLYNEVFK